MNSECLCMNYLFDDDFPSIIIYNDWKKIKKEESC